MIRDLEQVTSQAAYEGFKNVYRLNRLDPQFWNYYDFMNKDLAHLEPIEAGFLDLSRLE